MSILKNLTLTTARPVRANTGPVERARDKGVSALAELEILAEAKITGRDYAPTIWWAQ